MCILDICNYTENYDSLSAELSPIHQPMDDPEQGLPKVLLSPGEDIRVELTNEALSIGSSSEWVKSTRAGAVVVFAGKQAHSKTKNENK